VYTVLVNLQAADTHIPEVSRRTEAVQLPFKPTSNMLAAGVKAGGETPDVVWRIYRAMLDAARVEFASSALG
jgi:hypothetical protein